ncbi:hypothetical protein [Rosistilla oblonga]|uniref:hypothetical protein n=1 Tax=Rosistilla oblonga TaxID=2527990 RepID=UPI003A971B71
MSEYRGDSRHAIAGSEKAIRSLRRSRRHRDELSHAITRVPVRDANGQIERMGLAFDVDADRINAVVCRIARGVFFKETGRILPREIDITVDIPESFDQCDQETKEMMMRTVLLPLKNVGERSFADGLFRYKFVNPDADSCVAVWWMMFYNRLPVLCLSGNA